VRIIASLEKRRDFTAWSVTETVIVAPVDIVPTGPVRVSEEIVDPN
tara:strand:+ start:368 stop:505 length:138 start_codon:yes stop_codon:yes gene_type:complete